MIIFVPRLYAPSADIDYENKPNFSYLFERIDTDLLTEL